MSAAVVSAAAELTADERAALEMVYHEGSRLAGGTVLNALVAKCDLIDDEYIGRQTGAKAREAIMRLLNGPIGPVNYVHESMKDRTDDTVRESGFGKTFSGPTALGPKIFPLAGKYIAVTKPAFDKGLAKWVEAAKKGSPEACGEMASVFFCSASHGRYSPSDAKLFKLYKVAADGGVAGAKFMCAVCYFYGIGTNVNRKAAYAMLQQWKESTGTKKAKKGGWIARRFAEVNR